MVTSTECTFRWGVWAFFENGGTVLFSTFNAGIRFHTVCFGVAIALTPCALHYGIFLSWGFNLDSRVAQEFDVINILVVTFRFQIYKE
jgi:hypothetical protein